MPTREEIELRHKAALERAEKMGDKQAKRWADEQYRAAIAELEDEAIIAEPEPEPEPNKEDLYDENDAPFPFSVEETEEKELEEEELDED